MDCRLLEVPVLFLKGDSVSLSECNSQVRQLMGDCYCFDLDQSPTAAPEKVESTDAPAGDLEIEAASPGKYLVGLCLPF